MQMNNNKLFKFLVFYVISFILFKIHCSSKDQLIPIYLSRQKLYGPEFNRAISVKINEDHLHESKKSLFIQGLLQQGSQSSPFVCDRDLKAGRGVGSVIGGKREGFGCALIVAGGQHQHQEANQKWDILCDWLDELIQFSLAAP